MNFRYLIVKTEETPKEIVKDVPDTKTGDGLPIVVYSIIGITLLANIIILDKNKKKLEKLLK